MSVAITNQVSYTLKPTSIKANRKQIVLPSSNKTTFDDGDTCVFYLPSLKSHVMDGHSAYLRFTATITGNGYVDNTAQSFINRIQTYGAGGQLISDLQQYNVLANMMMDLQLSQSEKIGLSATLGTEDDYGATTATTTVTNGSGGQIGIGAFPTAAVNNGAAFTDLTVTTTPTLTNSNRKGRTLTNGSSYTFCIPLLHPIFTLSEKYWPCFAMSDDTRLEITWASVTEALVSSTNYTISNPEIIVDFIELDSSVFPLIEQTYSGRDLIIPAQDYRHYSSQIASGTSGNISQIIPAKQQSARAFWFSFRPAETQVTAGYAVSSRVCPFYSVNYSFNLNIGGMKVPPHPIRTRVASELSEWFASTQTALHAFNALEMNGSINRTYYQAVSTQTGHQTGADSYRNAYALGINLDTLRGQSQTQNSGINLSSVSTYYEGYIGTAPVTSANAAESYSVDAYLLFDIMLVVDSSGLVSVRF